MPTHPRERTLFDPERCQRPTRPLARPSGCCGGEGLPGSQAPFRVKHVGPHGQTDGRQDREERMTGSRRPLPLPLLRPAPCAATPAVQYGRRLPPTGHLLPTPAPPHAHPRGCGRRPLRVVPRPSLARRNARRRATSVRALSRWLPARPSIKGRRARSDPREGIGGRTTAAACPPPTKLV